MARRLSRLRSAQRTCDRLDWWSVDEWFGSALWSFDDADAALLIVPLDLIHDDALEATHATTAWLRWCAVADGTSPASHLAAVFREAESRLASHGVHEVWCIVHTFDWLKPYLGDLGYRVAESLLTFEIEPRRAMDASAFLGGAEVRLMQAGDFDAVCDLDARAFEEPWRYPPALMRRAIAQASVVTVAVHAGMPAGYACALLSEESGHVVRLAVHPAMRRQGIGAGLLLDSVARLGQAGAQVVSLNTQAGNHVARQMYRRLGFVSLRERVAVLRKVLPTEPGRGVA